MHKNEIVELMLNSTKDHPHTGELSQMDNYISAILLAKLCKSFADDDRPAEAMNIESKKWVQVIRELEKKLENITPKKY